MGLFLRIYTNLVESKRNWKDSWLIKNLGLERHHIVPKHSGGLDEESNYTYLSHREHIVAHWLLWRIHRKNGDRWAVCRMSKIRPRVSGKDHPSWGKPLTEDHKAKLRSKKRSDAAKEKYRLSKLGEKNPFYGKSHSEETKAKMHPIDRCPHCGKTGNRGNMIRWHFENCRSKELKTSLV